MEKYVTGIFESKSCLNKAKRDLVADCFGNEELISQIQANQPSVHPAKKESVNKKINPAYRYSFSVIVSIFIGVIGPYLFGSPDEPLLNCLTFLLFGLAGFILGHEALEQFHIKTNTNEKDIPPYQSILRVSANHPLKLLKAKKIMFKHNAIHIRTEALEF